MRSSGRCVVALLVLIACKRGGEPEQKPAPTPTPVPQQVDAVPPVAAAPVDAGDAPAAPAAPDVAPRWYRAVARAPDGIEAPFYLGVAPRQVTFKIGSREVRDPATFDGKTLTAHLAVYQTAFDLTAQPDGTLAGTFSSSWRAQGATSLPLTATPVAASALGALGTLAGDAPQLDLGEPHTTWRLATSESGLAKMELHQVAPGELEGVLSFDNGNIVYVAGNARGDSAVLTGFDDTSGYRLELSFDRHRKHARAKWFAGAHFDWRETATATRGKDFALRLKLRPARAGAKVGLPALPELAHLPAGPLLVELGGSWCSTCRNAAPFLHDLYREVQPRGLHFVTLLYEFTDDAAADAQQAVHYQQTYGVTWPIVAVPGSTDDFAKIMPSGIAGLDPGNFPLLLFLSPDRRLVAFHAGFAAPGTDGYAAATAEIRASVEKLLASNPR